MARDITVHFVGNARDLAASSAVAEASVDRFGNATAKAGVEAEAASVGFESLLLPLIGLAAAATAITLPIAVVAGTFAALAAGIVGLPFLMGFLGDEVNDLMNDLRIMAATIGTAAVPVAQQLLAMLTPLIPVVTQLGLDLVQWFGDRLPTMLPIVTEIFRALVGIVFAVAGAIGRLTDFFVANWQAVQQLWSGVGEGLHLLVTLTGAIVAVSGVAAPLAGMLQFLGHHMRELGAFLGVVIPLWVAYTVAQWAANVAMTANPIGLVIVGLAALAAGIAIAVMHWREISAAIESTGAFHALAAVIHAIADAFGRMVDMARRAVDAVRSVASAASSIPVIGGLGHFVGIPGFQEGGVVPGPVGAPMLAMVHGGETITPPGRGGAGTVNNYFTINVPLGASKADVGREVVEAIQEYERRGSASWRS